MKQLLTDEALFEALKKTNRDRAITQLYLEVFPSLYKSASKIVKDDDWAHDIATDRFWKCLDLVENMKGYDDLVKILYTATKHLSLNFIRKNRNWEEVYMEPIDMEEMPDEETMHEIEKNEVRAFVRKQIYLLTGDDKVIVQMAYFEDRTNKEIAEQLGKNVRSVEGKRLRLMARLRDAFRKAGLLFFFIFF
jgi:RNA polymerase sigma-70 factor (ECF subfamily)